MGWSKTSTSFKNAVCRIIWDIKGLFDSSNALCGILGLYLFFYTTLFIYEQLHIVKLMI